MISANSQPPTGSWAGDQLCDAFEDAWRAGNRPRIEDFLSQVDTAARPDMLRDLLKIELEYRRKLGEHPSSTDYHHRFPDMRPQIDQLFAPALPATSAMGRQRHAFEAGDMIAERYRIVSRIGEGGMGEVYRADDLELKLDVALKFLPVAKANDPGWIDQLKKEVELARKVNHDNVCRVHDLGKADGMPFLVMEYARNGSLFELLKGAGQLSQDRVVHIGRKLCDGLEALHGKGLLHRDLKPANVLWDNDRVLLADFGLAAVAETIEPSQVGAGTLAYMAPEQLEGHKPSERSDLFALGLVLYELTTGRRPFPGKSRDELLRLYKQAPEKPSARVPGLDPALDRVILRCLHANPNKRQASAREVKEALPPLSPADTTKQGGTGRLRPALALALLAAAVLGIFLHALLADWVMAFRQAPTGKDPDVLRQQASFIANEFGYAPDTPQSETHMLEWDIDLLGAVNADPNRWHDVTNGYSPSMYFWYRRSPVPLVSSGRVRPADPPAIVPDMVCVMLDGSGKLIEFHAVPSRSTTTTDVACRQWEERLFAEAKLTRAQFDENETPGQRPPVHADKSWSLHEKAVEGSMLPLRNVEIAICDGKPVYFRVTERLPANRLARNRGDEDQSNHDGTSATTLTFVFVILIGGALLAYRNWRLRRIDWQGALKVPLICLILVLLGRIGYLSHVRSLEGIRIGFMHGLGVGGFWALILGVAYMALEPYMRQRWPERLSSWNQLLDGQFRAPLVGRDILIGVIAGICIAFTIKLAALLLTWSGHASYCLVTQYYDYRFTPGVPPSMLIATFATALIRTIFLFVLLVLAGLIFRREWRAALICIVILTAYDDSVISPDPSHWITRMGIAASIVMSVLLMIRFGLLASLTGTYIAMILASMPLTIDFSTWYAERMILTYTVLTAITLYGFFVSLDGQPIIPD